MAVHVHPLEIKTGYYKPIGQIIVGWNVTEALIASIIWHFHGINNPKVGRLFTYRPRAEEKLAILRVTAKEFVTYPSTKTELLNFISRAATLKSKRNMLAHGLWGHMPTERSKLKVFFMKDTQDTYTLKREPLTADQVKRIAADLSKLNADLNQFRQRIGAPPP